VTHFGCSAGSLNGDLRQARDSLTPEQRAGAVAVLLPDLPKLQPSDVEAMVEACSRAQVVLCPDHLRVGTNGLVLNPACSLDFLFEGASFERHRKRAQELGRTVLVLERPGLANDADEEDDLRRISLL
jgi:2-phospho-L-lactate guanylyltransferase